MMLSGERRPWSPVTPERLRQLCTAGDIFSPNEREAVSLVGPGTPMELVARLAAAGAAVVCLRRGGVACGNVRKGVRPSARYALGDPTSFFLTSSFP
jgi:sugar/nucleoside kinase (ribokinase family)